MYGIQIWDRFGNISFYPKNFDDGGEAERTADQLTRQANRAMNGYRYEIFSVYRDGE